MISSPASEQMMMTGEIYKELGPNYSNQERLTTQALMVAAIPGKVLQEVVRPNIPGLIPFPPRFGYPDYVQRQPTIRMVINVERWYPNRRTDLSGGVAAWQSSARNVGSDVW
jgi:hypothetical protein